MEPHIFYDMPIYSGPYRKLFKNFNILQALLYSLTLYIFVFVLKLS